MKGEKLLGKTEKDKMYKQMSDLLKEYEDAKSGDDLEANWEMELYHALRNIHDLWPEIIEVE